MSDRKHPYEYVALVAATMSLALLVSSYPLREYLIFSASLRIFWIILFLTASAICLAASVFAVIREDRKLHSKILLLGSALATALSLYGIFVGYGSDGLAGSLETSLTLVVQAVLAAGVGLSLYRRLGSVRH